MLKKILVSLLLLTYLCINGQNKLKYDLDFNKNIGQECSIETPISSIPTYGFISNQKTEISLLKDGYFTIGTNFGESTDMLDDGCQISFGHPYAMTSFPYFKIDGVYKYIETYFYGKTVQISSTNDTLCLKATDSDLELSFFIIAKDNGSKISLILKIFNKNANPINLGAGILFDPALGKWGDSFIYENNELIQFSREYLNTLPQQLDLWERGSSPKGLGISMTFQENTPNMVQIDNWYNLFSNHFTNQAELYDTGIKLEKSETVLAGGDSITLAFDVNLVTPSFPNGLFIRSQIPTFLSIENNILFPTENTVLTEIYNNTNLTFSDLRLSLFGGEYVDSYDGTSPFYVSSNSKTVKTVTLRTHEIYENFVNPITLSVKSQSQTIDQINRKLFIPASPISDSGLVVTIDTLIVNPPQVRVGFHTSLESTGGLINNLKKENVFLYEESQRIYNYTLEKDTTGGNNQVDIVFVLDVTGSMSEEINGVKNNIIEFTDSLTYRGIDYRLGMVTFLDDIENVYDFTANPTQFKEFVATQHAHGGADYPENSLDALVRATQFTFRNESQRIIIWVTDASFHVQNSFTQYSIQNVVDSIINKAIVTHCIGNTYQQFSYEQITIPTGGNFYNIYGNFRDILLDISRINGSAKYLITFNTLSSSANHSGTLELHYAGLGGMALFNYSTYMPDNSQSKYEEISCYPNPFNPTVKIRLENPLLYQGEVEIYNILGQKVKMFSFDSGQNPVTLSWDAKNDLNVINGAGIYFVRAKYFSSESVVKILPVQKIIYLK